MPVAAATTSTARRQTEPDAPEEDRTLPPAEKQSGSARMPAWIISAAVHLVVLFVFSLIMFITKELDEDTPPVRVTQIDPPPKPEEKTQRDRDIKPTELPLDVETTADVDKPSPVSELDVPVEQFSREEDVESDVPKGREEAIADSEMGGSGAFMAIGAGGGSSGMFGSRTGGGKKRALGKFGGSMGSESAVDAALRWFKKHQSPDGSWDVVSYPGNCTENPKCEPGTPYPGATYATTGYALLCFLGAGYDHHMPSKYKLTVKKGLDWMLANQKPEGAWAENNNNYENAVATMAMAEAYAMSMDPALKAPTQKGVDLVLKHQTPDPKDATYGLGWDYSQPNPKRMDSSVSGWNVMALKSAAAAGLNVGNGMEGAKTWLQRVWEATNPDHAKLDAYGESRFPYTWDSTTDTVKIAPAPTDTVHDLAPVGALCAVFLGHHAGDVMLETLCNYIAKNQTPKAYPCNIYYMYYNTLAVFQAGGARWDAWNKSVRDLLVNAQRKTQDCFDGSWDFDGTKFVGHTTGRLLSTAYCCLSLEVYYRYLPVAAKAK